MEKPNELAKTREGIIVTIIVITYPISVAIPHSHVNFVGYLNIISAREREGTLERSWEEEIDEALKVMERIAEKARPREDAAELVRRFRDVRRW